MAHVVSETSRDETLSHLHQLGSIVFDPEADLEGKLERLFLEETAEFGLETAFFSHIDPEAETQRFEVIHGSQAGLEAGYTIPLWATYCRKTITEPEGTLAISNATDEGWQDDPAHERFGIESYLGTVVTVGDELYGTLCFVDTTPRDTPLTDQEVSLVELYGQWVTYELHRRPDPLVSGSASDEFGERDISSSDIDSMLTALNHKLRRHVLLTLLDTGTEIGIETVEATIDADDAELQLRHNHLPRLVEAGYAEWDPDANTVSRGSHFDVIEPFLRLLAEYYTGVSR